MNQVARRVAEDEKAKAGYGHFHAPYEIPPAWIRDMKIFRNPILNQGFIRGNLWQINGYQLVSVHPHDSHD